MKTLGGSDPFTFFMVVQTSDLLRPSLLERRAGVMNYLKPLYSVLIGPVTTVKHSYLLVDAAYLLRGPPI